MSEEGEDESVLHDYYDATQCHDMLLLQMALFLSIGVR